MAHHELAVLVGAGQGAGVAIHAEDRRGDFGALLSHDEMPGLLTLRAVVRNLPEPRDRRDLLVSRRHRAISLGAGRDTS